MYALNLSDDGRILSATWPHYAPKDAVITDSLPDGNIQDYRYQDGAFVYDPLPTPEPEPEPESELQEEFDKLKEAFDYLTEGGNAE